MPAVKEDGRPAITRNQGKVRKKIPHEFFGLS